MEADGADPDVLETRVTHTRKSRSAFDGYNRGLQWERTCAEVSKLHITRGGRSSAAEQSIAAGSGEDSLRFAVRAETSSRTRAPVLGSRDLCLLVHAPRRRPLSI